MSSSSILVHPIQHSGTVGLELLRKFSNVNINLRDMTLMME